MAIALVLLMGSTSLWAVNNDPFPDVNPHDYYGNMIMSVKVKRGGSVLEDVAVAVYSGNEVRGKGVPGNPNNPGVIYLTVYGNRTGEDIYFEVYVESEASTYMVDDGLQYQLNGSIGTPMSPYELVIDDADLIYGCITVSSKNQNVEVLIDGDKLEDNTRTSAITASKVTYKRTFTTPYATICLPFGVSAVDAAAAGRFYKFSGINGNYEVEMVEESLGLTANTPYIVQPLSMDDEVLFVYNGEIDFPLSATPETTDSNDPSSWTFKGSWNIGNFLDVPSTNAIYFFANSQVGSVSPGDFVRVKTSNPKVKKAPFRAYLEYTGDGSLSMRAAARNAVSVNDLPKTMKVVIVGGDGTYTQIGTISVSSDDTWYSIDGVRLNGKPSERGLYINNGHKVLIEGL